MKELKKITRLEVIDEFGNRKYSKWHCKVKQSIQDNGRTLKLFVYYDEEERREFKTEYEDDVNIFKKQMKLKNIDIHHETYDKITVQKGKKCIGILKETIPNNPRDMNTIIKWIFHEFDNYGKKTNSKE